MCIPWWKRFLSYIAPMPITSIKTKINPQLKLRMANGRLQLSTPKAIYSYDELYDNYYKLFRVTDLRNTPIRQVLLLGFGMGSIPYMLERSFKKLYQYTAVELDEGIIQLARKYAIPRLKSNIHLVEGDATEFVKQLSQVYEMICVDIFVDDIIPPTAESIAFLEAMKPYISKEGSIFYNRLYRSDEDKAESKQYFRTVFLNVFPDAQAIDVEGNLILVSNPLILKPGAQDMVLFEY
ncbi:MAG: hypothetical protein ABIV51_12830 [Saprospiraceae bacterium]